ncbi:MAG: hypothetical protein RLO52_10275 [Sandaracinaceae bacterium]|nr:MAG: hypothetical protein EVA89_11585 [Sandaracinaceae bacterium]HBQ11213.1 hypothetical protein [Myxococcales bacterium]
MSIPSHLVSAKIAEARARGALERPSTDEARILADMERVLAELPAAVGRDALRLRAQLALHERNLAYILERTGQSILSDVLWDRNPSFTALR